MSNTCIPQYCRNTQKLEVDIFHVDDDQPDNDVQPRAPETRQSRFLLLSTLNMPFTLGIAAGAVMSIIGELNFIPTYTASLSSTALTCQLICGGIAALAFLKYSMWPGHRLKCMGMNMAFGACASYVMRQIVGSSSITEIPLLYATSYSVVTAFMCSEPKSTQKIITSIALTLSSTASFLYCSSIPHATSWIIPKTIFTMIACNIALWPGRIMDRYFHPYLG